MQVEVTRVISAPREKVYQAWTDYEERPKWNALFSHVTVTKREGETVHLATEVKIMGRQFGGTEKHTFTPRRFRYRMRVDPVIAVMFGNYIWPTHC